MANGNNIFKRFDSVMANADKGKPYAVYCYKRFAENFSKKDIELIENFRAVYTVKQNNLVSSIQSFSEEEAKVIRKFIDFAQDLPATKFTGWLRRIFGISFKDKQKKDTKTYEDDIKNGDISSYISNRWREQRKYFSKKSQESQRKFHRNQMLIIILSAFSVAVLTFDIDAFIRKRSETELEKKAGIEYDSLNKKYDEFRNVYNRNQELINKTLQEYSELRNDDNSTQAQYDNNKSEYVKLINEHERLVAEEVKEPDIEVIKAKLDVKEKNWYHPDIFSWNKFLCAAASLVLVIVSGFDKLKQHQLEWMKNRRATERLKNEISKYKFGVEPYSLPVDPKELKLIEQAEKSDPGTIVENLNKSGNVSKNARLFVERVETIISDDVDEFLSNKKRLSDFEEQNYKRTTKRFRYVNTPLEQQTSQNQPQNGNLPNETQQPTPEA